jgi:hypothetical protein
LSLRRAQATFLRSQVTSNVERQQSGKSSGRFQSEAVVQPVSANYSRWATPGTAADEFDATLLTFKTLS